jgi:hypothetical protein
LLEATIESQLPEIAQLFFGQTLKRHEDISEQNLGFDPASLAYLRNTAL